ncbi:hypothetical protein ACFLZN_02795 [Nanoarchaeota archaeon]
MIEGIIDGMSLVYFCDEAQQVFFRDERGIFIVPPSPELSSLDVRVYDDTLPFAKRASNFTSLNRDERRRQESTRILYPYRAIIAEKGSLDDIPKASQYAFVTNDGNKLLFSPDTRLLDPPLEYTSRGRFDRHKNRINDSFHKKLQEAIDDGFPKDVIKEYLHCTYEKHHSQFFTRLGEWVKSGRLKMFFHGLAFRFNPKEENFITVAELLAQEAYYLALNFFDEHEHKYRFSPGVLQLKADVLASSGRLKEAVEVMGTVSQLRPGRRASKRKVRYTLRQVM